MRKKENLALTLACIAAAKRAEEMEYQYCGDDGKRKNHWFDFPFWKELNLDKFSVKSIWRKFQERSNM